MPRPATIPDLVALIRRSRLIEGARLDGFLQVYSAETPDDMLGRMVAEGFLTSFQAEQLGQGKWKGFTVGSYRLLARLGGGGMGQVFLAEHIALGKRVAIKILTARTAEDPTARRRFAREARAAASITHPNIIHVIDVDTDATPPFLVMEYVDGVSLQAAVARHGTFDAGSAAFCGRQVALGLQRAADLGMVHRDIKPANLLVDRRGLVKILDLGIVRIESGEDLTLTGQSGLDRLVLGTADYLAPEQGVDSHAVDPRADIYALGGTLYFLLAGHPPFPEGTAQDKVMRKQTFEPLRIDRLRPDIPAGLAAVIQQMLAKHANDRYRTPLDAAEALSPFATPEARFPDRLFGEPGGTVADEAGAPTTNGTAPSSPLNAKAGERTTVFAPPSPAPPPSSSTLPTTEDYPALAVRSPRNDRPIAILLAIIGSLIAALAIGLTIYLMWTKPLPQRVAASANIPPTRPITESGSPRPLVGPVIVVGEGGNPSVRAAIDQAIQLGLTAVEIEVRSPSITEQLDLSDVKKLPEMLTIRGTTTGTKKTTWHLPTSSSNSLMSFPAGQRITVADFDLSVTNGDTVIRAMGGDLTFRNLWLEGFTTAGIELGGGGAAKPTSVEIVGCRFRTAKATASAIVIRSTAAAPTERVLIHENVFAYQYPSAVRFAGPTTAGQAPAPPTGIEFRANTFKEATIGVLFDTPALVPSDGVRFDRNLFENVAILTATTGAPVVAAPPPAIWDRAARTNGPEPARYFRGRFSAPADREPVRLEWHATGTTELYVNGRLVVSSYTPELVVESIDISPFVEPGENVLAVGVSPDIYKPAGHGLMVRVRAGSADLLTTADPGWKVRLAPGGDWAAKAFAAGDWSAATPYIDVQDLRPRPPAVVWPVRTVVTDFPIPQRPTINVYTLPTARDGLPPTRAMHRPLVLKDGGLPSEYQGKIGAPGE